MTEDKPFDDGECQIESNRYPEPDKWRTITRPRDKQEKFNLNLSVTAKPIVAPAPVQSYKSNIDIKLVDGASLT